MKKTQVYKFMHGIQAHFAQGHATDDMTVGQILTIVSHVLNKNTQRGHYIIHHLQNGW